eukprot:4629758-Prymnesium_polylepis.1
MREQQPSALIHRPAHLCTKRAARFCTCPRLLREVHEHGITLAKLLDVQVHMECAIGQIRTLPSVDAGAGNDARWTKLKSKS